MYFHSNFKFKAEFAIWIHVDGVRYKTIYGPIKYNKHKIWWCVLNWRVIKLYWRVIKVIIHLKKPSKYHLNAKTETKNLYSNHYILIHFSSNDFLCNVKRSTSLSLLHSYITSGNHSVISNELIIYHQIF